MEKVLQAKFKYFGIQTFKKVTVGGTCHIEVSSIVMDHQYVQGMHNPATQYDDTGSTLSAHTSASGSATSHGGNFPFSEIHDGGVPQVFGDCTQEDVLLLLAIGHSLNGSQSMLSFLSRDIVQHSLAPAVSQALWEARSQAGLVTPPSMKPRIFRKPPVLPYARDVFPEDGGFEDRLGPRRVTRVNIASSAVAIQAQAVLGVSEFTLSNAGHCRAHGGTLSNRFSVLEASTPVFPDLNFYEKGHVGSASNKRRRTSALLHDSSAGCRVHLLPFATVPRF